MSQEYSHEIPSVVINPKDLNLTECHQRHRLKRPDIFMVKEFFFFSLSICTVCFQNDIYGMLKKDFTSLSLKIKGLNNMQKLAILNTAGC